MSSSTRVVILLLTRAKLQGADSRLITLWSLDRRHRGVRRRRARHRELAAAGDRASAGSR